jgi:hypothetical protein
MPGFKPDESGGNVGGVSAMRQRAPVASILAFARAYASTIAPGVADVWSAVRAESGRTSARARWVMRTPTKRAVILVVELSVAGCTGMAMVRTEPPDAHVLVDGQPLRDNSFEYGRWMGNVYRIEASAPGYEPKTVVVDVEFGSRAALFGLFGSVLGLLAMPWNGQLPDEIFLTLDLEPREEPQPTGAR